MQLVFGLLSGLLAEREALLWSIVSQQRLLPQMDSLLSARAHTPLYSSHSSRPSSTFKFENSWLQVTCVTYAEFMHDQVHAIQGPVNVVDVALPTQ